MGEAGADWGCPVCGSRDGTPAYRRQGDHVVDLRADELAPAATAFGATVGEVVRCRACGHGSLDRPPSTDDLAAAYAHVEDASSLEEADGQTTTARRDLLEVRDHLDAAPGRLLDIGCWTGSLLDAAAELGWTASGVEPSTWAAAGAVERGHDVTVGTLDDVTVDAGSVQVVACCDVLEHLDDPTAAARRIAELLEPGGLLFATVPDAGSVLARVLGRRWWSVLPMHVQYFTRPSLVALLTGAGFEVVTVHTHPKVFTYRYYADRLGEFVPAVGRPLAGIVGRSPVAERAFGPDLRDRIAVVARRPRPAGGLR